MGLFQKAPQTPEEVAACKPLDIGPEEVLKMDEGAWYAKIYRGEGVPQLTPRAVFMGSGLGFLLAFTNLYIGLKTGWALGVAITACILSYAIWTVLYKAGVAKTQMTILENNCMQSTASSAGYSTGGTMVSAIAALLMMSATPENPQGAHLPWPILAGWTLFLGILGTTMAIPMKRSLINRDRLKFPSGVAAATTLQSLYSEGMSAIAKAKALAVSALVGALFPLMLEVPIRANPDGEGKIPLLPADLKLFDFLPALGQHKNDAGVLERWKPSDWTMVFDNNPVMIAAGALVGMRVAVWMLIGSLVLIYGVGPIGWDEVWTNTNGEEVRAVTKPWKAWKELGLWLGVPILVSSGLLSFAAQWKTIVRAIQGLMGAKAPAEAHEAQAAKVEVPTSWFAAGVSLGGAGVVAIGALYFDVPWYYGVLAVGMTFFLSLVACRATGESDITPVGAMGKLMQLTYGVLIPQSATANLMTASITASSAGAAADLLNDLKSGYLLGADPRRQFLAQFMGIFAGTLATVSGFYLLVPDATVLNGVEGAPPKFPAPSAQTWKAVAELFNSGIQNMHPMHQQAIGVGVALGVIIGGLEMFAPKKIKEWLPSATALGLGMILPFQYPFAMFIGAVISAIWAKSSEKSATDYLVPISSGVIAGVSIMGVLVAVLNNMVLGGGH
jgi:OPT family oligopeptide transporter